MVRPAEIGDIEAITAIYGEAVHTGVASYELTSPTAKEMKSRFEQVTGAGYPWLVADHGGKTVGYAYATSFRARPAYAYLVEDSIYLHADWRRQGIGRMLLDRLLGDCERQGYRQMLAVIGGAERGSVELHRRAGFRQCGTIHASGFKFGRWLDTVLMQRALGAGSSNLPV